MNTKIIFVQKKFIFTSYVPMEDLETADKQRDDKNNL